MTNPQSTIKIAIDGPAGAGKSTVAKELARRLKFAYLDTGAMYRALTLKALRLKVNLESEEDLVQLANQTTVALDEDEQNETKTILDGEDVSAEIRSAEVTNSTHYISRAAKVREVVVEWQREMGEKQNVVAEGRDIGTVVFPHATKKFYLDADFGERTKRRLEELQEQGKLINESQLKSELSQRDTKDLTRSASPLKQAEDAIFIDSTNLAVEDVVEKILTYIQANG